MATRRACDQCLGTDTQYECERGQCYAEECQRQIDEKRLRDLEEEDRMDCYQYGRKP
jgi:hypothetical protein